MQKSLPLAISPSRCELATRCERRHFVANVLGWVPKDDKTHHRDFGTALHAGAAAWWKTGDENAAQAALEAAWQPSIPAQSGGKLTKDLAEFMLRYYCADAKIAGQHWAAELPGWELVACEERVELDLPSGTLRFQLDRLVRNPTLDPVEYVLIDLKSAGRFGSYWQRQWPSKLQQKLYAIAAQQKYGIAALQMQHWIEGLLKSAPSELRYVELHWPDSVLKEALHQADELLRRDGELFERACVPALDEDELVQIAVTQTQTNGDDCWSFNRACELYELCHFTPPSARAALLREEFKEGEETWLE